MLNDVLKLYSGVFFAVCFGLLNHLLMRHLKEIEVEKSEMR